MAGEHTSFVSILDDGEEVDEVVKALAGPNRWLGLALATVVGLAVSLWVGVLFGLAAMYVVFRSIYVCRPIVVTNKAVLVIEGGRYSWKPKRLLERLPADTPLKPLKGLWLQLDIGTHRVYVSARSIGAVSKIEAERRDGKRP